MDRFSIISKAHEKSKTNNELILETSIACIDKNSFPGGITTFSTSLIYFVFLCHRAPLLCEDY